MILLKIQFPVTNIFRVVKFCVVKYIKFTIVYHTIETRVYYNKFSLGND